MERRTIAVQDGQEEAVNAQLVSLMHRYILCQAYRYISFELNIGLTML